jgi:hypothetical protein
MIEKNQQLKYIGSISFTAHDTTTVETNITFEDKSNKINNYWEYYEYIN